jgi:nucleoside 2-deoxyribosyltransferase
MKKCFKVPSIEIDMHKAVHLSPLQYERFVNRELYKAGYRPHMKIWFERSLKTQQVIYKWEEDKGMNIYLASPFFNETEVERVKKMAEILRAKGHEVFVPMEHQNKHLEFGSYAWRKATWQSDVDAIDKSDAIYAIVSEGNYSDDGTAWEIGYAYAQKKPIVVFNEDGEEPVNLMISDSLTTYLTTWDAVIALKDDFYFDLPKIEYTGKVV